MLTALDDLDCKIRGLEAGADEFLTKFPPNIEIITRVKSLTNVKALNDNLTSIENVLFSLVNAVEAKDKYTKGHTKRVANLAQTLGQKMGLSSKEQEAIRVGGMLHDIGKIGISADILNKPGVLDSNEIELMRTHAEEGYKICYPLKKNLGEALDIIRHHHEKLDGSGYPDGLNADEISMPVRIMSAVDIYDALVTDRPYRNAMPQDKALAILDNEAQRGKLDKGVVANLIQVVSKK
jgi:putative two-component system response regulator